MKTCNLWCEFVTFGVSICHFFGSGFASVVKGGPDPNKVRGDRKTPKNDTEKDRIFKRILNYSLCFFFVGFWRSAGKSFFCGLVVQTEATSGHFSSYVAAKLGSWKLVFRPHQTLLFRVLRGWVGTSWATISNIFSGMDFESWFYYLFDKLRVQP